MTESPSHDTGIFRKVSVEMYADRKFLALSPVLPSGRSLWLHLITGPHTGPIPGLIRIGRAAIAEELGWSLEAFDEAFAEVSRQGLAKADWINRVLWLPKALKHNAPQSPNVVRGWRQYWALVPDCDMKREAYEAIIVQLSQRGDPFLKAFGEACPEPLSKASGKTSPNQEQEQEKEKKEVEAASGDASTPPDDAPPTKPPPRPTKRGGRLPLDWQPSPENLAYAEAQGFTATETGRMAERFRNHFHAAPGQKGVKLDWTATWRNWVLSDADRQGRSPPAQSTASAASREMAELRKLDPPDWPPGIAPREFVRRSYVAGKWLGAWGPEPDSSGCRLTAEQRRDMLISRFGTDEARRQVPGLFAAAA